MADGPNVTTPGTSRTGFPPRTVRPRRRCGEPWLAAVAGAFTLAQFVLVRPDLGLGWDETGISLPAAPIASWSDFAGLLRVYLTALSGLGLYFALRVWRALHAYVAPFVRHGR
jgi:hypothetical protein